MYRYRIFHISFQNHTINPKHVVNSVHLTPVFAFGACVRGLAEAWTPWTQSNYSDFGTFLQKSWNFRTREPFRVRFLDCFRLEAKPFFSRFGPNFGPECERWLTYSFNLFFQPSFESVAIHWIELNIRRVCLCALNFISPFFFFFLLVCWHSLRNECLLALFGNSICFRHSIRPL